MLCDFCCYEVTHIIIENMADATSPSFFIGEGTRSSLAMEEDSDSLSCDSDDAGDSDSLSSLDMSDEDGTSWLSADTDSLCSFVAPNSDEEAEDHLPAAKEERDYPMSPEIKIASTSDSNAGFSQDERCLLISPTPSMHKQGLVRRRADRSQWSHAGDFEAVPSLRGSGVPSQVSHEGDSESGGFGIGHGGWWGRSNVKLQRWTRQKSWLSCCRAYLVNPQGEQWLATIYT